MTRAACTIVSINYLPYARTLCESFLRIHPEQRFYVLIVDRLPQGFDVAKERFEIVMVEELGIKDFESLAFKYDILELNTAVKPTFLRHLLSRGVDELIYLDPDICVYSSLEFIFDAARSHGLVLTPHCLSPNEDDAESDIKLLLHGIFNLGFIALSKRDETRRFLNWWESKCLDHGFMDSAGGLFVDQKWINLVPCFFDSFEIMKHPGCNVAYWNLHERVVESDGFQWKVNGNHELVFYHFSGIGVDGGTRISKHLDSLDLTSRSEMSRLFAEYREGLIRNGIQTTGEHPYAFGSFSNGRYINKLARSVYAANLSEFLGTDPFDASGAFYKRASTGGLLSQKESAGKYTKRMYQKGGFRVRALNFGLRACLQLLGADRYTVLMKYLLFISRPRNQSQLLPKGPRHPSADSGHSSEL